MSSKEQNLPATWAWATFGDVCKVQGGYAFKSADYQETGVLLVRISNLVEGSVEAALNSVFLPKDYLEKFSEYCLRDGDILIAMSGATTGKMATYKLAIPALLNQRVGRFTIIDSTITEAGYISKLVSSITQQVLQQAYGGAQPNISPSEIEQFTIPLPPLNEQRRIVAKIEALKARIQQVKEALEAIPPLLEQFRQSVLAAAFRGDLTADWREKNPDVEPASVLLERIRAERRRRWEEAELEKMKANDKTPTDDKWKSKYKETAAPDLSDLPDLPKGWCWATFEQVSERVTVGHVGSMKDEYIKNGIPFLRSQNVRENRFDPEGLQFISQKFHEYLRKSSLQPGDLVVVRSGSVGVACVIPETLKEANCSDLIIVKQPQAINSHYGAFYMNSIARSHVNAKQVGVALNHFNTKSMADLPIAVPPLAEQKEILCHIQNLFKSAVTIEQNYQETEAYIDQLDRSILAKAFRGELVPQDPNDEPASILLERIRAERAKRETEAKTAKKFPAKTTGQRRKKTQQQDAESVQLGLPGLE